MRTISWDNIKYFIVTARAGSLTAAANALRVSPATLSRRLANLEFELGQLLFARSPTGYTLTKEGRALLESLQRCGAQPRKKLAGVCIFVQAMLRD
jgi:DNA-binding transcriptional LysR family regulator